MKINFEEVSMFSSSLTDGSHLHQEAGAAAAAVVSTSGSSSSDITQTERFLSWVHRHAVHGRNPPPQGLFLSKIDKLSSQIQ